MRKTLAGFCSGAVYSVVALAALGGSLGFVCGSGWAGMSFAYLLVLYYGWFAAAVGGTIGGLAGLVSWLVQVEPPRRHRLRRPFLAPLRRRRLPYAAFRRASSSPHAPPPPSFPQSAS